MDCHIVGKSPLRLSLVWRFFVHDTVNLSSLVQMGIVIIIIIQQILMILIR